MGIYVFTWKKLRQYLIEDESDEASSNDFGKNIIPKMLQNGEKMAAYRFSGYWKDVGTLDSLWDANMDMLATRSRARSSRKGLADLWPLRLRAAGVLRRQRTRGAQRRRARLHGRGRGGELRPL